MLRRTLPKLAVPALLAITPVASASDGAAEVPAYGGAGYGELERPDQQLDPTPALAEQKPKRAPKVTGSGGRPLLTSFRVRSRLYLYGRSAPVTFQIDDRAATVSVRLIVRSATTGAKLRKIDIGAQTTGAVHRYRLTGREGGAPLPAGRYRVRVRARDASGNRLVRKAGTSAVDEIGVYPYRFPLKGNFAYGDPGSRFGAPRSGHKHQGQDVGAPEGTQVRAARGGIVKTVAYQGSGAGHYIVIDGAGENRDYAYMHLQTDSIRVQQGQRVKTGKWIANVGNTGASFGAHLHFEIWQGPWWGGGEPFDPYPSMQRWDSWS